MRLHSIWKSLTTPLVAMVVLCLPTIASAQDLRPSLEDSFRLGSSTGLLCQVQSRLTDQALNSMFDRAYAIVCRDAATAVGQIYVLRTRGDNPAARLDGLRGDAASCESSGQTQIEGLGSVATRQCTLNAAPVGYRVYSWQDGDTMYVAEGLAGYDSALQLALRSIVADQIIPGELSIATTQMGDAAAFARVQAGTLDPDQALAEGYRRNNAGDYAEAAEFFQTLLRRNVDAGDENTQEQLGEYLINQALQQSNLGQFAAAESTYARALAIPSASRTQLRLRRNFRALHLLNQRRFTDALAVLDEGLAGSLTPLSPTGGALISDDTAAAINSDTELDRRMGGEESDRLTVTERAVILDAQARLLRGSILHTQGDADEAVAALNRSLAEVASIRNGRVRSTARLQAQALAQLAAIDEAAGSLGSAESRLRSSVALMEIQYPLSIATSAAKARLAAFLARRGNTAEALTLFAAVVEENRGKATVRTGLENQLAPYFDLLLAEMETSPELVNDFFLASEILVRPGVANTQAVLARELSGGNDEAARLFRQSVTLTRATESTRIEIARLQANRERGDEGDIRLEELASDLAELESNQTATQAQLARFPRYRAVSTEALTLANLRETLRPGEAYFKLNQVAGQIYAILVTSDEAFAYLAGIDAETLDSRVTEIRSTISIVENAQRLTYPFDAGLAYQLYTELVGPAASRLANIEHLIFEPDGAMMRLPLNLLITEEAGVLAYENRLGTAGNDEFDFTGIAWLGREMDVSTAVSARNFRDARALPASSASRQYLGFGENARPDAQFQPAAYNASPERNAQCRWPAAFWSNPVSASELRTAQAIVGESASELMIGSAFSDTAMRNRDDLNDYRILHFATHGLVTQPLPECPPRPALVTSFGSEDSDGLLSFGEIFDLQLNADLVILSACDTASAAGIAASLQAGVRGGDSALDGLVRAFIGAGSRTVIASHWPAPDDFSATERLISGLFEAERGSSIGSALRTAQYSLMDDPATSHPYYWSGFAVVGDATQAVLAAN